ncbi:MAG: FecR domain-containing protein, partial [Chitinophagaceae bacterium]|nr:FecR domain-containing protein [Chitinophagaceae bacterium]
MQDPKFTYLVKQYAAGQLTDLEWNELSELLNSQEQETLSGELINTMPLSTENGPVDERMKRIISDILELDKTKSPITIHRIHFLKTTWFRYAAAIILIFGIGAYLYTMQQKKTPASTAEASAKAVKNDVLPGTQKAILTLSDGKKVELNNAAFETIHDQTLSIENNNGQLIYSNSGRGSLSPAGGSTPREARGEGGLATFNTMTTPKGGQYQLTLSDGTKVWLNAASSITYPTAFRGNTREVSIIGEAYFEVAKNAKQPFHVKTSKEKITVLGTEFNVHVYDEEPSKTSLIEGSVKINDRILQPGQAFVDGKIIATNIEQDIAWKNGYFPLEGKSLRNVMRELER